MNFKEFLTGITMVIGVSAYVPSFAQQPQMVEVSLTDVKSSIAKSLGTPMEKIPLMVEVPPEIAKKVCAIGNDTFKPQANNGIPSCPAKTTSDDLNKIVQRKITGDGQK